MRARMIWIGLLLSLLLPVVTLKAQEDVAILEPLQGVVQVRSEDEDDWQTITEPTEVQEGDRIRTGEEAWAIITFFDGTYSELLDNTEIDMMTLEPPASADGPFAIEFSLRIGDTLNTVSALVDMESKFRVHMPGMTASVRGTVFQTRVIPTGCSMVYTEEGVVDTAGVLNENNPISIRPGEFIIYNPDGTLDDDLEPDPFFLRPEENPEATIAPASCGDGVCSAEEEDTCTLDCGLVPETCGNAYCEEELGEGLLTCPADCGSLLDLDDEEMQRRKDTEEGNARVPDIG